MTNYKNSRPKSRSVYATVLAGLCLAFLLQYCANPTAPAGGPRDEQAPRIDSARSTPNFQTNFDQRYFELTFDEWIVLEEVRQQVVVSPPLDFELSLKRRTVRFEVKEGDSLRSNTTYTVNFGEAIQDLTEGNPAENLRFVFSTGPVLDSLRISGQLFDIVSREAVEDAYFMLYDNLADSVVFTERPYYFGRTDDRGRFTIENVRAGTYKGFALKASGIAGYEYTNTGEQIAFPDTLLEISATNQPELSLPMFVEQKGLRFFNAETDQFGLVKMLFNQAPPETVEISLPDSVNFNYTARETDKDTLLFWYDKDDTGSWSLLLTQDTSLRDTVRVSGRNKQDFLASSQLQRKGRRGGGTTGLTPGEPISLEWNHPLASFDTNRIELYKDSLALPTYTARIDSVDFRTLAISASLQQDSLYRLLVLPGGLIDIYGLTNVDSVDVNYRVGNLEDFGNIILNITNLDSTQQYLGELRDGDNVIDTFYIDQQSEFRFEKRRLRPKKYTVRLIEDRNANREWDTGSYDLQRQAEPIYTRELEQLRANWDLDETISLPELFRIIEPEEPNSNGGSRRR